MDQAPIGSSLPCSLLIPQALPAWNPYAAIIALSERAFNGKIRKNA